jgi:beta-glucanase (GH16 family)
MRLKKIRRINLFLVFVASSVFLNGCKKEEPDGIAVYFHDTPDMAFISSMTLQDNYDFDKATFLENGFIKRSDHSKRRGGYWNSDTITFENGCAVFDASYRKDGMPGVYGGEESPAGFYGGAIMTKKQDYTYGYYEARIKMPMIQGFWGAFWITAPDLYKPTGVTGAELDIVEAMYVPLNSVSSAIHYNYGDLHSKVNYYTPAADIYNDFCVYGLLWEETSYKFFVNGKKVWETDFGGVSEADEYIILSMECGDNMPADTTLKSSMIVDYVRVYT